MQFKTLMADPPWKFGDSLPGSSRGAAKNYRLLSQAGIENFLVTETIGEHAIKTCLADDCRLFLWRVASMQEEALNVMESWGFTQKAEIVWIKVSKSTKIDPFQEELGASDKLHFGMGRTVRMSHEVCLIGQRGKPEVLNNSTRSVFFAPYTRHSEKPEIFYSIVEQLSPGPYLELFARKRREGWVSVGDELAPLQLVGRSL